MKNLIWLVLITFVFGCESSSESSVPSDSAMIQGLWKVKSYVDNKGRDQTSNYSLYTFNFMDNGELEAKNSGSISKGSYTYKLDSGKQKLIITLPSTPSELEELNEDWILLEKSGNQLVLKNLSGGNGGTSTLIFVK